MNPSYSLKAVCVFEKCVLNETFQVFCAEGNKIKPLINKPLIFCRLFGPQCFFIIITFIYLFTFKPITTESHIKDKLLSRGRGPRTGQSQ